MEDVEHDGRNKYLCPSCTEEAVKLMNIPPVAPELLTRENIDEDIKSLMTDCSVFANWTNSGNLDEPWDTTDFDNWQNMVNALGRIKQYIDMITKQTP